MPSADKEVKVIVEFKHEATVKEREKQYLPLDRPCTANLQVIHHIQSLESAYSSEVSTSTTVPYLAELKDLAKRSSKSWEMARIGELVGSKAQVNDAETPAQPKSLPFTDEPQVMPPVSPGSENVSSVSVIPQPVETVIETISHDDGKMQTHQLLAAIVSTPEVSLLSTVL